MSDVRCALMRGNYHRKLIAWINAEMKRQEVTQDSLAAGIVAAGGKMHQTTFGGILKDKGTFDLDEAEAVLRLLGSSLQAFLNDPANAVTVPDLDAKVRRLMTLGEFVSLVNALGPSSPDQLREFLDPIVAPSDGRPRHADHDAARCTDGSVQAVGRLVISPWVIRFGHSGSRTEIAYLRHRGR